MNDPPRWWVTRGRGARPTLVAADERAAPGLAVAFLGLLRALARLF